MLLSRAEMTLDFAGEKLAPERDREILQWIFNQFLYGEVTGIQVGQWLYDAPDLESARFLAKQAIEELQHVGSFLRIMQLLGVKPGKPHPAVRFLATGMMGGSWAEHVAMEMATGEGFVLMAFYAVIDTLDHPEAVEILQRAVRQEEGHVTFGEQQTMRLIADDPALRRELLGLSLVWMWGVQRLASFMQHRLPAHPVLARLPDFLALALRCNETRLLRMGVLDRPLSELGAARRSALIAEAYARKGAAAISGGLVHWLPLAGKKRLTETYLDDPLVRDHGA
jgi:1,2-phenylacetyl-CoA epoxidase catalytic subunit